MYVLPLSELTSAETDSQISDALLKLEKPEPGRVAKAGYLGDIGRCLFLATSMLSDKSFSPIRACLAICTKSRNSTQGSRASQHAEAHQQMRPNRAIGC